MQQIIFILLFGITSFFAYRQFSKIYRNIMLGKATDRSGNSAARWQNVVLVAFGQKKMFKNWIPAIFHLCSFMLHFCLHR
jgi:hypothetical protein